MCSYSRRFILAYARHHNGDHGIKSIFDEMSKTNFNPTLVVGEQICPIPYWLLQNYSKT